MIGSGFQNIFKIPELKKRILFTLGLLIVYRVGVHVPVPGIDAAALASFFARAEGTIFGIFNMFSGGALQRLSVFALGIMPYISASIILQLLTVVIPHLEQLKKEGEQGRKKITQYTRYGTVFLSIVQGFGISVGLESMSSPGGAPVVLFPGWAFRLMTVITLTAGTAFIMWLGEQITERGIGNGISLIIFAGIVARLPTAGANTFRLLSSGEMGVFIVLILIIFMVLVVGFIIFVEQGQRRIPVQYAKRVVGRKMYGGQSTHLPLKINTSGVIPPIFASSIIMFPATIANFINIPWIKAIGYIPGIRPGKRTADYIDKVLTRITLGGAIYVSLVCVMPSILITRFNIPFYFGGTALLIVVGVAIDTVAQIESHMLSRHYEGFLKQGGARLRSR
jgi:preprotein translocase subunit SecY